MQRRVATIEFFQNTAFYNLGSLEVSRHPLFVPPFGEEPAHHHDVGFLRGSLRTGKVAATKSHLGASKGVAALQ
jgi:hypothetical protein